MIPWVKFTSVTAGAFVRAFVGALLAGVVTQVALPVHGVTALLTVAVAAPIVKEPAGEHVVHSARVNNAFTILRFIFLLIRNLKNDKHLQ